MVNGQEKRLSYIINGIDYSTDFIGNTAHGMGRDEDGRYIASQEDFEWWQSTIAAHEQMDAAIAACKETNDPDEVDRVVQDWIDTDLDMQPKQVMRGLEQAFGAMAHPTDEEINEELRQLADDTIYDDYPETEQESNRL